MSFLENKSGILLIVLGFLFLPLSEDGLRAENRLPDFGRDTVLVWKIQNGELSSDFVVRIAEFSPDRYLEWEDEKAQGTLFMSSRDIQAANSYINTQLFVAGLDTRGKNATTLWLSRRIFEGLKEKKRAKINIDGVQGRATFQGEDRLTVEVNRRPLELPVIRVSDDRGSQRWFLDQAGNPLLVKHVVRNFSQTLVSVTTDRPNTLRWIKGRKLANLPR